MSQLHFKRIAARAMRQLLVEAARRRNSRKRGGEGEAIFVTFDDAVDGGTTCDRELLALNVALDQGASNRDRQRLSRADSLAASRSLRSQSNLAYRKRRSSGSGAQPKPGWDRNCAGPTRLLVG